MAQPDLTTIHSHLVTLYGESAGDLAFERLRAILSPYLNGPSVREGNEILSERDSILITYANQLKEPHVRPFQSLSSFCEKYLSGLVSSIHVLPFFPHFSDNRFSIINYQAVKSTVGKWEDVSRLGDGFRLMFDAVINHVSVHHEWFQAFLRDVTNYRNYFIVVNGEPDLSAVSRPNALPLLTEFNTRSGASKVWTTFSADQVDLNFQNPHVLLEIVDTLLFYVDYGAQLIRLDAAAYLWKEIGTPCIHLPQTHTLIKLLRAVLDVVAPHVLLITETNFPHQDNLSYFGDGCDEAHMVYNFALPPLVLHAFQVGNSRTLSNWAADLKLPSRYTTFFNFLASQDGIGIHPVRGILSEGEIDALVARTTQHGGLVAYKDGPDGTPIPHELNINYFDALSDPRASEPLGTQVDRFMAAQAIMLALVGVPGIYFHSLFGSRGWRSGVDLTGRNRTINRQKFDLAAFESELADEASLRHQVFHRYERLLRARSNASAFHPHGGQQVLDCGDAIFALLRLSPDESQFVLCLHNVSDQPQPVAVNWKDVFRSPSGSLIDLITLMDVPSNGELILKPYQILWLRMKK